MEFELERWLAENYPEMTVPRRSGASDTLTIFRSLGVCRVSWIGSRLVRTVAIGMNPRFFSSKPTSAS